MTAKAKSEYTIKNLKSYDIPALKELLERQNKLLNNRNFIQKLPDKGEKISALKDKILNEIKERDQDEEFCKNLADLSLQTSKIEWKNEGAEESPKLVEQDESAENPLEIISGGALPVKLDPHIRHIIDIDTSHGSTDRFLPFKSLTKEPPKKEKRSKLFSEVTAATPPADVHSGVRTVGLEESLKLQLEHTTRFQKLRGLDSFANYRVQNESSDEDEDSSSTDSDDD